VKIKLTKGELKKQRDALAQYLRYLPTLQLKKQQLQLEILQQAGLLAEKKLARENKNKSALHWAGLLIESPSQMKGWIKPQKIIAGKKNIAGIDIPVFQQALFAPVEYDLFSTPLWVDIAVEHLMELVSLDEEMRVIQAGIEILKQELRLITQRVNLFEKVKIPEAQEAIRLIKIYISDQMINAVGRSKIAKRKIEEAVFAGAMA